MFKLVVGFVLLSCAFGNLNLAGIWGGTDSFIEKFPFQASIHLKELDYHICSGSLYKPTVVITSASCLKDRTPQDLSVHLGSENKYIKGFTINVASLTLHPEYDNATDANDIGLMHLSQPVVASKKVDYVKLASKTLKDGTSAFLSGWAFENPFAHYYSDDLKYHVVNVIDRSKCDKYYFGNKVKASMFCAITHDKPKERKKCQGESGSPLTVQGVQYGVLSWGPDCEEEKDHTAVFTNVADFKTWIEQNA